MVGWKKIGEGSEAYALSGIIDLSEISGGILSGDAEVVKRVEWAPNEHSAYLTFLKNLAAYLLDAYFRKRGKYAHQHVSQPIGISESDWGTIYEYFRGSEGFPWCIMSEYREEMIQLGEWNAFVGYFAATGIGVGSDVTDPDDARVSKNIILGESYNYNIATLYDSLSLPPDWRRIDFGSRSCPVSAEKLYGFISSEQAGLYSALGSMADVLHGTHGYMTGIQEGRSVIKMYHKKLEYDGSYMRFIGGV